MRLGQQAEMLARIERERGRDSGEWRNALVSTCTAAVLMAIGLLAHVALSWCDSGSTLP